MRRFANALAAGATLVVAACGEPKNPESPSAPSVEMGGSAPTSTTAMHPPPPPPAPADCPHASAASSACGSPTTAGSGAELLTIARCEGEHGRFTESLKDGQRALERGIQERDSATMKDARSHVKTMLDRIPHVTFEAPKEVALRVTFDDRDVPTESFSKKFSVDPGRHIVQAHADNGKRFSRELCIAPGDFQVIRIQLE
jgi:hypothetical protein